MSLRKCLLLVGCAFLFFVTSHAVQAALRSHSEPAGQRLHSTRSFKMSNPMAAAVITPSYHWGATLRCNDCHTVHQSKQHAMGDEIQPDPFGGYPQQFNGGAYLLKTPDPIDLCLTCHDNQAGIPDVVGADVNGLVERSAGYFDAVDVRNPRGHSLARGLKADPNALCDRCHTATNFGGSLADASVTCIDCHNPHGNGDARNLQWASWPGGEPPFGLIQDAGVTGLQKYEAAKVGYATNNTTALREVTNMCWDCHHTLTGDWNIDPDGNGWHNRHPSYDSEQGSTNNIAQGGAPRETTDPAHWDGGTGAGFGATPRLRFVNPVTNTSPTLAEATRVDATINGVFCLSCHQAHGNGNAFALRWNPVSGVAGDGCDQCHDKSRT